MTLYGGDDYTEFRAPGSAGISCHCSSTDGAGPRASWSWGIPGGWITTTDTTSTDYTGASGAPPAKRNTRGPCRQLKTAKVTRVTNSRISIGYDERHRAASTADLHNSLAHDIGHVIRTHCPMQWKSWRVMPDEIKMQVHGQLSTNYHLEEINEETLAYVNRLFGERYKQWKSDLHHHFQAFDDPQVALQEGCPEELEGREDSWAWLCAQFQAPDYVNKAQVNKGNRKKKTLLHHSGSRPFSYRMDARRGSKFPEIDVFGDVYVRPGNELAESLHTTMVERSQLVLQESASQLPPETPIESVDPPHDAGFQILTQTLDQTLGRRPGTYCRGMGNARQREPRPQSSSQANNQVIVLTSRVAELEGQMSVILQSLARSGIPIPNFGASTSEPVYPGHPQHTTAPADAHTSEPHVADDQIAVPLSCLKILHSLQAWKKLGLLWLQCLYDRLREANMCTMVGFIDPAQVSANAGSLTDRSRIVASRLQKTDGEQIFMMPYNPGRHWVLLIVRAKRETVYFLDPLPGNRVVDEEGKNIVNTALKIYNSHIGRPGRKAPIWKTLPSTPKQPSNVECGYYVMRFMREIIMDPSLEFEKKFAKGKVQAPYPQEAINEVRNEWADLVCLHME
ncbi:unnamed protein product [Prunus armeniaca]